MNDVAMSALSSMSKNLPVLELEYDKSPLLPPPASILNPSARHVVNVRPPSPLLGVVDDPQAPTYLQPK